MSALTVARGALVDLLAVQPALTAKSVAVEYSAPQDVAATRLGIWVAEAGGTFVPAAMGRPTKLAETLEMVVVCQAIVDGTQRQADEAVAELEGVLRDLVTTTPRLGLTLPLGTIKHLEAIPLAYEAVGGHIPNRGGRDLAHAAQLAVTISVAVSHV